MNEYIKVIDGIETIKPKNKIVVYKDGLQYINPHHNILVEDGWEEYIAPELTEQEKIADAIDMKIKEIQDYDSSAEVNQFYVSGLPVWLDKATRAGLLLRFQAEKAQGLVSTALWYNGMQFPLSVNNAIAMLYAIELYASACYDNTQRHLAAVNALTSIEEIEQYDYKVGYPEKLNF